ncbi:MAG: response regulator [Candidatus Omnitrophica bacterium]|nr:response regulator [Candidatus Omnitrophota bacterium]
MKKRVLICDDEEGVRESLNLILEKDYDVAFATNGDEAVKYIKNNPTDLIILDIKMPKTNGIEALREIKKERPNIGVVIATGYQSAEIAEETIKLGASDYITKPFDRKNVLEIIKNCLK